MNQAELQLLVKGLRVKVGPVRKIPNAEGYRGGLLKTRAHVSALLTHERLELSPNNGVVTRLYAERLLSDAITYGPKHKHTMEMATWWLHDNRESIHKLFQVYLLVFFPLFVFIFCVNVFQNWQINLAFYIIGTGYLNGQNPYGPNPC